MHETKEENRYQTHSGISDRDLNATPIAPKQGELERLERVSPAIGGHPGWVLPSKPPPATNERQQGADEHEADKEEQRRPGSKSHGADWNTFERTPGDPVSYFNAQDLTASVGDPKEITGMQRSPCESSKQLADARSAGVVKVTVTYPEAGSDERLPRGNVSLQPGEHALRDPAVTAIASCCQSREVEKRGAEDKNYQQHDGAGCEQGPSAEKPANADLWALAGPGNT